MKTKRLGRGLDALIPQAPPEQESRRTEELSQIEVALIRVNPKQPRLVFDSERLAQLKASIQEHGVIQPITVHKVKKGYELISGERRLRAVSELGYDKIPAYIYQIEDSSEDKLLELALIENIQREDLNAIEVAKAYQQLQKEYGLTQEQVAQKVGKDRATVANFVRLLKLPDAVQTSIEGEDISMGHARALMGLSNKGDQIQLCRKIIKQQLSVRQVEETVRKMSSPEKTKTAAKEKTDPAMTALEDRCRGILGSQVKIRQASKGGKIEISYFSRDDLDRLVDLFESIDS